VGPRELERKFKEVFENSTGITYISIVCVALKRAVMDLSSALIKKIAPPCKLHAPPPDIERKFELVLFPE
jgi:hypothetical protein